MAVWNVSKTCSETVVLLLFKKADKKYALIIGALIRTRAAEVVGRCEEISQHILVESKQGKNKFVKLRLFNFSIRSTALSKFATSKRFAIGSLNTGFVLPSCLKNMPKKASVANGQIRNALMITPRGPRTPH